MLRGMIAEQFGPSRLTMVTKVRPLIWWPAPAASHRLDPARSMSASAEKRCGGGSVPSDSVVVTRTARLASASAAPYSEAKMNVFCAVGRPAHTTTASSCGCDRCSANAPRA